jgi:hypothetical protein
MAKYFARVENSVGLQTVVANNIEASALEAVCLDHTITVLFDNAKQQHTNFESINVILRYCGNIIREIFGNVVFVEKHEHGYQENLSDNNLRKLLDGSQFGWVKTPSNKKK